MIVFFGSQLHSASPSRINFLFFCHELTSKISVMLKGFRLKRARDQIPVKNICFVKVAFVNLHITFRGISSSR